MGTLVWDRIVPASADAQPVEDWGGISYAIEALTVALPEGWVIEPIIKVGEDLADQARSYLSAIPRVSLSSRVVTVPGQNYKVELLYLDETNREERLVGDVPPWTWAELAPCLEGLDALYVNFITGLEMDSETARALPEGFPGPRYADLHSLFLGITPEGRRFPRELPDWRVWLTAFDAVQVNEEEFRLLCGAGESRRDPAAEAMAEGLELLAITKGPEGAAYLALGGLSSDPLAWKRASGGPTIPQERRQGRIPLESKVKSGDPTGCGDVWGATFFAKLLGGEPLEKAMADANRLASLKVGHKGARGLRHHLKAARS
jgi:hypothetical protein